MAEHLGDAVIHCIDIHNPFDGDGGRSYWVGNRGVTRIEAFTKPGMHSDIPYVRVWKGDKPEAEFCQHNIVGVYFAP